MGQWSRVFDHEAAVGAQGPVVAADDDHVADVEAVGADVERRSARVELAGDGANCWASRLRITTVSLVGAIIAADSPRERASHQGGHRPESMPFSPCRHGTLDSATMRRMIFLGSVLR